MMYLKKNGQDMSREMSVGESVTIEPGTIHRVEAIKDSYYLETSTVELWDVVRLEDKYNRENTIELDYK